LGLLTENSEFHDRAGEALTLLGVSVGYRRASRPAVPDQAIAKVQVPPWEEVALATSCVHRLLVKSTAVEYFEPLRWRGGPV
jgi:hypothetical protein